MTRVSRNSLLRAGCWTVLVLTALLMNQAEAMAAEDVCISAAVSELIVLPDGSEHSAQVLTLCLRGDYSPVASLHDTYVNRMPIGRFLSRRGVSECPTVTEPFMMFYREPDGRLRLYGYALPARDHMATYLLGSPVGGKAKDSLLVALDSERAIDNSPDCIQAS